MVSAKREYLVGGSDIRDTIKVLGVRYRARDEDRERVRRLRVPERGQVPAGV